MATNTWSALLAGNWSTNANWSLLHKPAAGEDIVFDATSVVNCTIDENTASMATFTIANAYTGVVDFGSKTLNCVGDFSIVSTGRINRGTSTVNLTGTGNISHPVTVGADYLYNVNIAPNGFTTTITSAYVVVVGTCTFGTGTIVSNSKILLLISTFVNNGATFSGTGNFNFQGAASCPFGNIGAWSIDFVATTYNLTSSLTTTGYVTVTSYGGGGGRLNTNNYAVTCGKLTIASSTGTNSIYCGSSTISAESLTISTGGYFSASSGTMTITANDGTAGYPYEFYCAVTGTFTHNNGTVSLQGINGTGGGTRVSTASHFYNLEINKTGHVVFFSSDIFIDNNYTITSGVSNVYSGTESITTAGNLVNEGGMLAGGGTYTIGGNLSGGGSISPYTSNFYFNKVGTATISGTGSKIFYQLSCSGSTQVNINNNISVLGTGMVPATSGNFTPAAGVEITFA